VSAPTSERREREVREPVVREPAQRTGPHVDVTDLPDHALGHHDTVWWGTLGFILIEGMTLAVCFASYFYLSRNFGTWPPPRTAPPGWLAPTANMLLVLATILPSRQAVRAAERFDPAAVRRWMIVLAAAGTLMMVLRVFEFLQLNTRWDEHAYGSIVWATMVFHTAIVATDWGDSMVLLAIFVLGREEKKHFSAVVDNAAYWYFVAATFVATWLVLVVYPRVL
jgi:cytochrome c oxidase subunit 3